ncbi:hypothetical protein [Veillonella sp.]|uniref:hypothetical protein n=1 Tax=Veillonella sp. TaxID=1926307 RepID=UPI00207099D8|nr:hypothetical protein [Veillonella sp.]DAW59817.1 MAG TPA: hypothetical protein [Caudoviricetes sp.]
MTEKQALRQMVLSFKWRMRARMAVSLPWPTIREEMMNLLECKVDQWLNDVEHANPATFTVLESHIKAKMERFMAGVKIV